MPLAAAQVPQPAAQQSDMSMLADLLKNLHLDKSNSSVQVDAFDDWAAPLRRLFSDSWPKFAPNEVSDWSHPLRRLFSSEWPSFEENEIDDWATPLRRLFIHSLPACLSNFDDWAIPLRRLFIHSLPVFVSNTFDDWALYLQRLFGSASENSFAGISVQAQEITTPSFDATSPNSSSSSESISGSALDRALFGLYNKCPSQPGYDRPMNTESSIDPTTDDQDDTVTSGTVESSIDSNDGRVSKEAMDRIRRKLNFD